MRLPEGNAAFIFFVYINILLTLRYAMVYFWTNSLFAVVRKTDFRCWC